METVVNLEQSSSLPTPVQAVAGGQAGTRRDRRALATTIAGITYRVLDASTKLVTIPIAARFLGVEKYGIWLTANSLLSLLMVSDFGIGSGLLNAVGAARARGDNRAVRSLTATAYLAFSALAVALLVSVGFLSNTDTLMHWLGIQSKPLLMGSARRCFIVLGLLVSSAAVLNVINFFALAVQEGYLEYLAQVTASLASLVLILTVHTHSMSVFALLTSLPIILAYLLLTAGLFGFRYRYLFPSFRGINRACFQLIWSDSSRLLIAQIADTIVAFTSNILVASQLGAVRVPEVSVSLQIMMICSFVCCMFLIPLWPAYVEANVHRDWKWIRSAFRRGMLRSMGVILVATSGYACIYRYFIHTWSSRLPIPPLSFVLYLDVWFLLYVWNKNFMVLLNGLGRTQVRAWAAPISAGVFVLSVRALMPYYGINAVGLGGIASAVAEGLITNSWGFSILAANNPTRALEFEVTSVGED